MVDALGHTGDYLTLEPSAGTGNLIAALFDTGHAPGKLVAVEMPRMRLAQLNTRASS